MAKERKTFTRIGQYISGFKFSDRNSDGKGGGGIGLYVRECINYKVRNDIESTRPS